MSLRWTDLVWLEDRHTEAVEHGLGEQSTQEYMDWVVETEGVGNITTFMEKKRVENQLKKMVQGLPVCP